MDADGYVRVEMELVHSRDAVMGFLSDADKTMRLGTDITDVKTAPDGPCAKMTVTSRGLAGTMRYVARRCPTANGWRSTMLESDDFKSHDIEWLVAPSGQGTRVTMRVRVVPRLPVPQMLIRRVVGGALSATLKRLDTLLRGG